MVTHKACTRCGHTKPLGDFALKGPARPGGAQRVAAVCKRCFNTQQQERRAAERRERLRRLCPMCGNTQLPTHTRGPLLYELRAQRESKRLLSVAIELHDLYLLGVIDHPLFRDLAKRNKRNLVSVCGRRWINRRRDASEKGK